MGNSLRAQWGERFGERRWFWNSLRLVPLSYCAWPPGQLSLYRPVRALYFDNPSFLCPYVSFCISYAKFSKNESLPFECELKGCRGLLFLASVVLTVAEVDGGCPWGRLLGVNLHRT